MSHSEGETLKAYLDRLLDWSNQWHMQSNIDKCKVMYIGYNNTCLEYTMGGAKWMMTQSLNQKKVLVLCSIAHLNLQANCVKKANQILGMIQRTTTYLKKKSLVRPHMEYAVQACHHINNVTSD